MPLLRTVYVQAVSNYLWKLAETPGVGDLPPQDAFREAIQGDFEEKFAEPGKEKGVADWTGAVGNRLYQLPNDPSKVGIAREYVDLLLNEQMMANVGSVTQREWARAATLAKWVGAVLDLPPRLAEPMGVVNP